MMQYITCKGQHTYLCGVHFKLLSCLHHENSFVNLLTFLSNLLENHVGRVQNSMPNSISHHYLIKLLVGRALQKHSTISWDDFIFPEQFVQSEICPKGSDVGRRFHTKKIVKRLMPSSGSPSQNCSHASKKEPIGSSKALTSGHGKKKIIAAAKS